MLIQKLFGASLKPDVVSTLISIINDDIPVASRQLNVKLLMTEFSIRLVSAQLQMQWYRKITKVS